MYVTIERTRLIFSGYNSAEKKRIEDLVGTIDKVFLYQDPSDQYIGLPTGMLDPVKRTFPHAHFIDRSNDYWPYAEIVPIQHQAKPRNKLQEDFIEFTLKNAKEKKKIAGILSPGVGKAQPLNTKIPTPTGHILMGDIKPGYVVLDNQCLPTQVTGVFPQGVQEIYEVTLMNGRKTRCSIEHLWNIKRIGSNKIQTITLGRLMRRHYSQYMIPYWYDNTSHMEWSSIKSIRYIGQEECQCIMVDNPDHLYMTENDIITHNTFLACYCAIELGIRTLIIVPTSGIKVQWAETLTNMFSVDPSRVLMVNSPRQFINVKTDFTIVSQASLAALNNDYDLERIMHANQFGIKVIDEVQMWFHNIIKVDANSNICHNWYLTGTFGRSSEEENTLYQQMFGDIEKFKEEEKEPTLFNRKPGNVYGMKPHMNVKMIWSHSGLSKEEIKSCTSSMRYSERAGKWMRYGISMPKYTELVIPSDGRITKFLNTILKVVKMADKQVDYGRMLVLTHTIASTEILRQYLERMYPGYIIGTIHSKNSKADNTKVKAEADILISTVSSAGTGFDVKDLSKLVVAEQFKSWILADQVSGRLRRRPDGKDTYMWDIVDADIAQLRAWANARADVLRKKSKTFKVVDL